MSGARCPGGAHQCARNRSSNVGPCPEGTCELQSGVLHPRWHNHSTAELVALEAAARLEAAALKRAVRDRLIAEAGIEIGAIYRVADDGRSLAGRRLWVEGVNAGIAGMDWRADDPWEVFAWGRLNGKSAAGDGWTIKRQQVRIERLTKE